MHASDRYNNALNKAYFTSAPDRLCCDIALDLLEDPVIGPDRRSYSKVNALAYICSKNGHAVSPRNDKIEFTENSLRADELLEKEIQAYRQESMSQWDDYTYVVAIIEYSKDNDLKKIRQCLECYRSLPSSCGVIDNEISVLLQQNLAEVPTLFFATLIQYLAGSGTGEELLHELVQAVIKLRGITTIISEFENSGAVPPQFKGHLFLPLIHHANAQLSNAKELTATLNDLRTQLDRDFYRCLVLSVVFGYVSNRLFNKIITHKGGNEFDISALGLKPQTVNLQFLLLNLLFLMTSVAFTYYVVPLMLKIRSARQAHYEKPGKIESLTRQLGKYDSLEATIKDNVNSLIQLGEVLENQEIDLLEGEAISLSESMKRAFLSANTRLEATYSVNHTQSLYRDTDHRDLGNLPGPATRCE